MITIAFYNLKGGVGKTTTAVNMAYMAAAAGKNTVLWDLDPQAAATWLCQQENAKSRAIKVFSKGKAVADLEVATPFPGLSVIPADLSLRKMEKEFEGQSGNRWLKNLIKPLADKNDILIYDCAPSLSPAMEQLLSDVDIVLIPMIPSPLSIRAMEQVIAFFGEKKNSPQKILGFFNQVDMRRNLHRQAVENLKQMPVPMLKSWIPMNSAVEQMALRQAPLTSYASHGRAALAYQEMWKELARLLRKTEREASVAS